MILPISHALMEKTTAKTHKSPYAQCALEMNIDVTVKATELFVDLYSENRITTILYRGKLQ